jgi:hypothetical protein
MGLYYMASKISPTAGESTYAEKMIKATVRLDVNKVERFRTNSNEQTHAHFPLQGLNRQSWLIIHQANIYIGSSQKLQEPFDRSPDSMRLYLVASIL